MPTFTFDVEVSLASFTSRTAHGSLEPCRWLRTTVAAGTVTEAHLTAAQMASRWGMVVRVLLRE